MIKNILLGVGYFIGIDYILGKFKYEGKYYLNHAICNGVVVKLTLSGMISSYFINNITNHQILQLYNAKMIIYSLHIYHILWYFKKLRRDDWLHHILMIGIVLPLTELVPQNNIISHALFFTTGLPGLIDYTLLYLNRNNLINKYFEKRVNTFLNLWIRAPGCIMNTTMSLLIITNKYNQLNTYQLYSSIIMMSLVYWNGIYFMTQVLTDYNNFSYYRKCLL
jgi:hypothetical protein